MKRFKPPLFVVATIISIFSLPGLILLAIDIKAQSEIQTEVIMDSNSPDGKYSVHIDGRMGTGLLNVPVYVTIYGERSGEENHCCVVETQIDNNNGGAVANANVWTVWTENNTAVVVLMGKEQWPELIEITFGLNTNVVRKQTPETSDEARVLLETNQIDIGLIPSQYW